MEKLTLQRKKVYDLPLRLIHAWNGLCSLALMAGGWFASNIAHGPQSDLWWHLHIRAGYALSLGLLARLIWGFIGNAHARWRELFRFRDSTSRFGHDPHASIAYLAVYALWLLQILTGLGLASVEHGIGPLSAHLFDRMDLKPLLLMPHRVASYGLGAFVLIHLIAMAWHERKDGRPIAQSMVSGFQYLPSTQSQKGDSKK